MIEGDFVFCYVSSGISAFSDIRTVQSGGLRPLRGVVDYDSSFDFFIPTAPLLTLDRDRWLPLKNVLDDLDLTKGRRDWGQMFRTSLRSLTDHDARLLRKELEKA